jgi:hypothetical protein
MLYSDSGGGDGAESWPHLVHRHPYWAAPDVAVRRYIAQGKTRPGGPKPERYPALPEAWSEERLLQDIAAHERDKIVVCHDCVDAFDERELCQHCWFCDVSRWWSSRPLAHGSAPPAGRRGEAVTVSDSREDAPPVADVMTIDCHRGEEATTQHRPQPLPANSPPVTAETRRCRSPRAATRVVFHADPKYRSGTCRGCRRGGDAAPAASATPGKPIPPYCWRDRTVRW